MTVFKMNEKRVKKGMKNTVGKYAKKFMIIHVDKLLFLATSCTFIFAKGNNCEK